MTKTLTTLLFALALGGSNALAQDGNADAGEKKVAQCIGCHGIPGYQMSFPQVHKVPKIAGQSAGYIVAALQAYKKGDRRHPTMRGEAGSLGEQDMADIAAFYQRQGAQASIKTVAAREPSAAVAALLAKGVCESCHGADYSKPIDPSYPKIAGQYPDYLFVALRAYQTQGNPVVGRNNPVMGAVASQFTPAELKLLADYMGQQPGVLATVPQSRWR